VLLLLRLPLSHLLGQANLEFLAFLEPLRLIENPDFPVNPVGRLHQLLLLRLNCLATPDCLVCPAPLLLR